VPITEKTIEVNSHQWFYREVLSDYDSDLPPVLLLHGLPSHSYTWRQLMPVLAEKGMRAIAPDWLGSGLSSKPDRRDFPYTPAAYLAALSDFISALEIEKFSLLVQGFLASVGLQYACRHPEAIARLVILNTPLSPAAKLPWTMQQWGLPFLGDMLTQDPLLVDRALERGSGFVIADKDLAAYRQPFLKSSAAGRALVATIQNLQLPSAMAELATGIAQWQQPTLILWGMADSWLGAGEAEELAASKSNVELVRLPTAKHYPQEHWAKEINPQIVNFLRRRVS
jgi:haloalkane dehalogenase